MASTSAGAADDDPLTEDQIGALLETFRADFEKSWPADDWRLPQRALSAEEWCRLVQLLHGCYPAFAALEPVLPTDAEPGSEEKIRVVRSRFRQRVALFSDRDRQLPHTAAGACRALSRLANELARQRRAEASARVARYRAGAGAAAQNAPAPLNGGRPDG
jgi:hypothetical protein